MQLGDLSVVLDDKVKELVCELSGKDEYEFGDLSTEIDKKVKESVASFCGKDKYEFGDLSKEGEIFILLSMYVYMLECVCVSNVHIIL